MAATILDSLLLEVGIDASKFEKEAKKVDKGTEKLQKTNKKTANSFGSVKKAAIGFISALAVQTGIVKMVNHFTDLNTQLDITSKNLGTSTKNLKSWQNTAELMGGSTQSVTSTMDMLSKSQTEFLVTGQTGILPYMRALGVSMYDATGKAKPLDDIMLDLADRFGSMDRVKANSFGQMMGIDQGTLNMLLEGRDAVQSTLAAQRAMRKTTDEEAAASTRLSQARSKLNQQFEAVAVVLVTAITPALTSVTEVAADFFGFLAEHEGMAKALFIGLAAIITGTLLPSLFAAIAAIGALISPFLVLIGVITAVSVAVGLLWDDFDKWSKGGKSALGGFFAFFKKGFKDSGRAFKAVVSAIKKYWDDFTNFFKAAWKFVLSLFTGDKKKIADAGKELAESWANSFLSQFAIVKKAYEALTDLMNDGAKATKNIKQEGVGVGSVWGFTKDKILKPLGEMAGNVIAPKAEAKTAPSTLPITMPNRDDAIKYAQGDVNKINGFFGGAIKGFTPEETAKLAQVLEKRESSGRQKQVNEYGYLGLYQFGAEALADIGYIDPKKFQQAPKGVKKGYDREAHKAFLADKNNWLIGDMNQYLNNKSMQDTAFKLLMEKNIHQYSNGVHGGDKVKMAGFGFAAHLKGAGNARKWYGQGIDSADAYNSRTSSYAKMGEKALSTPSKQPSSIALQQRYLESVNNHAKARDALIQQENAKMMGNTNVNIQKMEVHTTANTIKGVTDDGNIAVRNRTSQLGLGMM